MVKSLQMDKGMGSLDDKSIHTSSPKWSLNIWTSRGKICGQRYCEKREGVTITKVLFIVVIKY